MNGGTTNTSGGMDGGKICGGEKGEGMVMIAIQKDVTRGWVGKGTRLVDFARKPLKKLGLKRNVNIHSKG